MTEYKYGDVIPADVKTLETLDGDLTFSKDNGNAWRVKSGSAWGMRTYENDGSLLWQWAQHNPLVTPQTKLERAKAFFKGRTEESVRADLSWNVEARRHASVVISEHC